MKTAFLFPGQGAQFVGMGKDVAQGFRAGAEIFARADKIVGYKLSKICFEGPAEKLNTTIISQPAIFATSAASLEVLKTEPATSRLKPDVTAGLSLDEYTALYAAGVLSFEDGLLLVQRRGQAMQAAADATEGGMVGIIGLDEQKVVQICREAGKGEVLAAVNFNCPGQIVVSGSKSACERAGKLAEEYGAIKAMPLAVAGAFHTEMMADAAQMLGRALEESEIANPGRVKVIANVDAEFYQSGQAVKKGLVKQLTCPLLWQKCMERLFREGIEDFYEIGPGRVLTGLMKRIDRKRKVVNISSAEVIEKLLSG